MYGSEKVNKIGTPYPVQNQYPLLIVFYQINASTRILPARPAYPYKRSFANSLNEINRASGHFCAHTG